MKNAEEEKERKAKNLAAAKEQLTLDIQEYGLWVDESEITQGLEKQETIKSKRQALKAQLHFRNKVLETKCDRSLFFLSSNGVNKTIEELKENLLKVISWKEPEEAPLVTQKDFSQPITLPCDVVSNQKSVYLNEALKTSEKLSTKKHKQKASTKENAPKKAKTKRKKSSETKSPVISSPDDLIGKIVLYFCERDDKEDWYKGVVVRRERGSGQKTKFLLLFYQEDELGEDTIVSTLFEDYKQGNLKLCDVLPEEFINAGIEILYKDSETGLENWWPAEVIEIDNDNEDPNNPKFFIYFTDTDSESTPEYFLEPLLEWYMEGWVRFTDCSSS